MYVSHSLTANKRKTILLRMGWCHMRGKNHVPDEGEASSRGRAVEVRGRSYSTHSQEFSPDARCEYTRENIAYNVKRRRRHRHAPMSSTHCWVLYVTVLYCSCSYRTSINRNVVFSSLCGAGMRYGKSHRSSEYHAKVRRGALADL
jgi:hypothetical protein